MATTRLRLDDMPDNLKDIKKKEYLEESGSDVEVNLIVETMAIPFNRCLCCCLTAQRKLER